MDDKSNFTASISAQFKSRELDAFRRQSRFDPSTQQMIDHGWANTELIPFLRQAYGERLGDCHDWWEDLRVAQFKEPHHMPDYPVADPVFIERLRLALVAPNGSKRPSLVVTVAEDRLLTIRLLIRRYVMHGGAFLLASLPLRIRPGMEREVREATEADTNISALFVEGWKNSE
ncbi:hypothetical protein CC78DRAFT_291415 [Lojkania enalia]|uniref:Uncharacterized protein n=1 Tax=Lojkania enalia TaxID=147567 RepID=A0A9P4N2X2_9PLEO|nr:hypothetical protein CC78DRAFT_291415 [Didymosphaeria enalia]